MMLVGAPAVASTAVVVLGKVYVSAGLGPAAVLAREHLRMYICSLSVVFVASTEETVAEVVSFTLAMGSVLVLIRSTTRLMVSPGTTLVALTLRRLAAP